MTVVCQNKVPSPTGSDSGVSADAQFWRGCLDRPGFGRPTGLTRIAGPGLAALRDLASTCSRVAPSVGCFWQCQLCQVVIHILWCAALVEAADSRPLDAARAWLGLVAVAAVACYFCGPDLTLSVRSRSRFFVPISAISVFSVFGPSWVQTQEHQEHEYHEYHEYIYIYTYIIYIYMNIMNIMNQARVTRVFDNVHS